MRVTSNKASAAIGVLSAVFKSRNKIRRGGSGACRCRRETLKRNRDESAVATGEERHDRDAQHIPNPSTGVWDASIRGHR